MNDGEESGSGADSGWSGVSDNSSTDSEGTILEASSVASTKTGLTLHMRHFGIFPRAFMTLTPGSMLGGSQQAGGQAPWGLLLSDQCPWCTHVVVPLGPATSCVGWYQACPLEGFWESPLAGCPCWMFLERLSDSEDLSNNCSATIGAQLAGNHTYRVFIKRVNPPLALWCGVPSWYFLFPLCSLFSLQIILTKPVLPRALSDAALGRLREALLSNSLYSGSIQNPRVNRGSVSNGIGQIISQDQCQVRGCLDYLPRNISTQVSGRKDETYALSPQPIVIILLLKENSNFLSDVSFLRW